MSRLSIAAIQSLGSSLTDMREREETILNSRHVNMMMGYLLCDSRLMQNSINLQQAGVKRPLMVLAAFIGWTNSPALNAFTSANHRTSAAMHIRTTHQT
jgi:hypothetical protein